MRSLLTSLLIGLVVLPGCSLWNGLGSMRLQSLDEPDELDLSSIGPRLVGDLAVPFGLYPVKVEAVGLVTGLNGTGSDPRPSPQRAALLSMMQKRDVKSPNAVLASKDTALVVEQGILRPGIQKGDRFDIRIRIPSRSETTSLRGGWLMETRLKEMSVMPDNRIHNGHTLGLAQGAVMVDPSIDEKEDHVMAGRGVILGGGICLKSRPLALVLKPDHQSVLNSSRIETAVNRRFHKFESGIKQGVANAKTDEYIELAVHPRYLDNIPRYVSVVRSVVLRENERQFRERLPRLEKQLLDPITSSRAALQLEAIGKLGTKTLEKGMHASDPEVRFYSAEALAYLNRSEAAEALADAARQVPAFRVFALTALSAMEDFAAYDALRKLLDVPSAETRYGAFRALWAMNPNDPLVMGEALEGQFSYHVLDTQGKPMVHVTRSRRPELVLFGMNQRFELPMAVDAGNQIMVTSTKSGEIAVSRFAVGEADQKRTVSTRLDDVIRAVVELGGTYPDVVQALQEAKADGALASRFEVDAVPEAGRTYTRVVADAPQDNGVRQASFTASSPLPDLFNTFGVKKSTQKSGSKRVSAANRSDSDRKRKPTRGFFARMIGYGNDH